MYTKYECVPSDLGHADGADVELCDALVGFVSSLPHPIILRGVRREDKVKATATADIKYLTGKLQFINSLKNNFPECLGCIYL